MAAGLVTPTEAGMGPSVLNIAASIGAKIRDAAQEAKEEREKAAEKGETPKKGSLFKSSLANQFNPIKSKKAKSSWAKQFDWNKKTESDQQVKPPTGGDGDSKGKLKEFIAGGFTAILKDTGLMVSKLDGVKMMTGENLSEVTRASSTLTVIKESIDAQTELRRKALEEAKYARAEKKLEKTSDVAGLTDAKKPEDKGGGKGEDGGGGGGPFDWLLGALGIADILENFLPGIKKLNPFKKSPVTQGKGGKPSGPRMPGTRPKVTTSGGAPAPAAKQPWWKKMLPFADDAAKGGAKAGAKGAGGLLGRLLPGAQTALGIGLAAKSFTEGDAIGGALNLGSALPGPLGWAFLAASLGRDTFAPGLGNKELGQAFSTPGLTPQQMSGMSGLERGMLDISTPSFTGFSEGGIVPSAVPPSPISPMAEGGIAPGLYDNPTQGMLSPGQSVIPLNRSEGKAMLGKSAATSPGETAMDTVGAMILGVSAGMLGKTDSGTVGDQVKQNIRKASKQFGISNLTFTSAIGRAQFGKVDTKKDSKEFLLSIFKNMSLFGGGSGGGKKGGGGGGNDKPPGADLENTQVKNEVDLAANTHKDVGFTPGQQFGDRGGAHRGSDIGTMGQKGYYVALKKSGKVVNNDYDEVSGNWVGIDVGGGVEYRFMHLANRSHLKVGDTYSGETIGEIGNTGRSSGEHLHFEKLVNGKHVDPKSDASALLSIGRGLERTFNPKDTAKPPVQTKPMGQDTGTRGSGDQASLPDANVTQVAQDGMMGPSWLPWNWGKVADKGRNEMKIGYNARYNNVTDPEMRRMMGLPPLQSRASGGVTSQAQMRQKMRASEKSQRATAQRKMLGVFKDSDGKWKNYGASPKASDLPWWQVWNKKAERNKRTEKANKDAAALAQRLNKQEAAKLKPKPAPAKPPSSSGGTRPAPSSGGQSQSTAVVMPPAAASKPPSAIASGSFGSAIPSAKTSAMVFADFLYPDLV